MGRSRGGFGTKLHLVVDGHGIPLAATLSAGEAHESKHLATVLEAVCLRGKGGRPRRRPKKLAGDKGYSYPGGARLPAAARHPAGDPHAQEPADQPAL